MADTRTGRTAQLVTRARREGPVDLRRSTSDRLVAGVAGGIGERLGVDAAFVRLAALVLATAGAVAVPAYLLLWAFTEEREQEPPPTRPPTAVQAVALAMVVTGVLLLSRAVGLWFSDALTWPVALAAAGSAVIYGRGSDAERARWTRLATRGAEDPVGALVGERISPARLVVGAMLVAVGVSTFLAANDALAVPRSVVLAVLGAGAGMVLVLGPGLRRLVGALTAERRERIRSEERAEVAAHLHDSVLQTLTLIQRIPDQPRRMAALARAQERELRAWLYSGRTEVGHRTTLHDLLDATLAELEAAHDITIEQVVVGPDLPVDVDLRALVSAVRESLVNVAKHAEVDRADLYVEVGPAAVEVFVRDRGRGFDPATVGTDRHGLHDSVRARMRRHGGRGTVRSVPGDGTEVELVLPRAAPEAGGAQVDATSDTQEHV